jgi:hypothetical protein
MIGSARYSCSSTGVWSGPTNVTCKPQCSTAGASCSGALRFWSDGGNNCSGFTVARGSGYPSGALDNETSTTPGRGSAQFMCCNGSWEAPTNFSCN